MANTCTVSGNVKNLLNTNVEGATVKVSALTPFFHGAALISGEISSTTTDASGNWSLAVIETETVGRKLTFQIEYYDGVSANRTIKYTVVVPDDASATLADLVAAAAIPSLPQTVPATNVTVNPSGNLASTTVQTALEEHQTDIDAINTLADGKIYLGNASNVATEVTPSGDVTMDNAGVTAIASGVIVNADINASAAIALSKLAAVTASRVLVSDGSGFASASGVSATTLGYLDATSSIQTQIDAKASSASLTAHESDTSTHGVGEIVGCTEAQTLTNKTIDADASTITNIKNADIKAAAAIARSKLASGTNYRILANSSAGVMSENAALTAKTVIIADANGQLSGIAPGSANNVLKSDGTDWTSGSISVPNLTVNPESSTYTVLSTDDVIICSGASFTLTLPTAVGITGKKYSFKHTDATLGRVYTIDGDGSETIDGAASQKLFVNGDSMEVVSDGTNWIISNKNLAKVAVRASRATAVSIADASATKFTYDTEQFDTHSAYASGTFTAPRAMKARVSQMNAWGSGTFSAGVTLQSQLYKNGSLTNRLDSWEIQVTAADVRSVKGTDIVDLAANDTIEIYLFQNNGGAENTVADSEFNYFTLEEI